MSAKILVVDDEPLILITVEKALVRRGYLVVTARTPEEFEAALGEAPFDLLLTDIYIEGLIVDDVVRRVRDCSPDARVVKMSGSVKRGQTDNFLEKPFRIEDLREKVRKVLDEPCRD